MAKKSFGVRSSLSVQAKQISPDEVEKAIQQIHQAEEKAEAASTKKVEKPSPQPKPKVTKTPKVQVQKEATEPKKPKTQRKVRLSVDVTPEVHKKLKIRAIQKDSDIMRYVAMLIEKDLDK